MDIEWILTLLDLKQNIVVVNDIFLLLCLCSLGRTPKRKLSLSGNDCLTPTASGTFQRSLSTVSNESGTWHRSTDNFPRSVVSSFTFIHLFVFTL